MRVSKVRYIRKSFEVITVVVFMGLIPIMIFPGDPPWSGDKILRAISYFAPIILSFVIYDYGMRYRKLKKAPIFFPMGLRSCILCGQPNDYTVDYCKYCGNDF